MNKVIRCEETWLANKVIAKNFINEHLCISATQENVEKLAHFIGELEQGQSVNVDSKFEHINKREHLCN